jgi:hypothetical protein
MRVLVFSPLAVIFLLAGSPAGADIITFNSSSFAMGVDVSHALEGLTLQRLVQQSGPTYAPAILPVLTSGGWYGPNETTFGGYSTNYDAYEYCSTNGRNPSYQGFSCFAGFSVLEVTFDAPTNFVSLVGHFGMDAPLLMAYASDGTRISTCGPGVVRNTPDCLEEYTFLGTTPPFGDTRSTLSITRAGHDISRVVWGSFAGASFANGISYNVPEPSTLMLVGLGAVLGVARQRRSRRRRPSSRG